MDWIMLDIWSNCFLNDPSFDGCFEKTSFGCSAKKCEIPLVLVCFSGNFMFTVKKMRFRQDSNLLFGSFKLDFYFEIYIFVLIVFEFDY